LFSASILQLARELGEILRKQTVEPAESCSSGGGVSFLDKVIYPLYEIMAAVSVPAGEVI
jgi:callose synthase